MKKIICLILTLALGLSAAAGLAASAVPDAPTDGYVPGRVWDMYYSQGTYEAEGKRTNDTQYEETYHGTTLQETEVELEDPVTGIEYEVGFDPAGNITRAEYENGAGEIFFDGQTWTDAAGNQVTGPDLDFVRQYLSHAYASGKWYSKNTLSVVGLPLKDELPGFTNQWYEFVPVDLRKEGTTRYLTFAGGRFLLGYCDVTVKDGTVTTDYVLPNGHAYPKDHCLMWFTDEKEITPEVVAARTSPYRFGQPVSIEKDLKGKGIAIMMILNRVTFRDPLLGNGNHKLRNYYRNSPGLKPMKDQFRALLKEMREQK